MWVIDWSGFQPTDADIGALVSPPGQMLHIRLLVRQLVQCCLRSYPWQERSDLIQVFDPSRNYKNGDVLAIPVVDGQSIRPDTWRVGKIKSVQAGENPVQGSFQAVQLIVEGKEHWLAASVAEAQPLALRFPPINDEMDLLVDDIVNHYQLQLSKVIDDLIAGNRLSAVRQGEQVFFGRVTDIKTNFQSLFDGLPTNHPFLTIDEIILNLWDVGELTDTPETLARILVEKILREHGFQDMGVGRWTTSAKLAELDRKISRRLEVPRTRSKIKAQWNQAEELDADDYLDLPGSGHALLKELNVEEETPEPAYDEWKPPTAPVKMQALSYLNIMQGYFPLNDSLIRVFPPRSEPGWVDIQIVDGEEIPFVVNLKKRELKSVDSQVVYRRFVTDLNIPAGTFLWLEYRGENRYRIAPRPIATPKPVRCKQAWLEDGLLHVEENDIEMRFEGDEHLFRAELRFEDIAALFREAEERDQSIFDAIYDVLPKLAILHPDGLVHHKDIFNAVFFEYRMCSYHTVVHELYDHACFEEAGNGFFRFVPDLGVKRRRLTRKQIAKAFWKEQPVHETPKSHLAPVEPEFWRQIAMEISRKLETLDEHKPFEITSVTHETIELIVSTGQPRTLPRADVEQAWNELSQRGWLDRERATKYANFNIAYLMAILAVLPGVSYELRPLRLIMKNGAEKPLTTENVLHPDELLDVIKEKNEFGSTTFEKTCSGQFIASDLLPTEPLFSALTGSDIGKIPIPQLEPDTIPVVVQSAEEVNSSLGKLAESPPEREELPFDLKSRVGQQMFTLHFVKPFVLERVDDEMAILITPTGKHGHSKRQIPVTTIKKAWNLLKATGRYAFVELFQEVVDDSAYIAAILSTHDLVTVDKQRNELNHETASAEQMSGDQKTVAGLPEAGHVGEGQQPAVQDKIESQDSPIVTGTVISTPNYEVSEEISTEELDMESKEAFDALIGQLKQELQSAQALGAKAFQQGKFSEAQSAAKRGEGLAEQLRNLESLRQKWENLVPENGNAKISQPVIIQKSRVPRGQKTSEMAFTLPILSILNDMGGKGKPKNVIDRVGEILKTKFTEVDMEFVSNGRTIRWRNTAMWARNNMVKTGLLSSESPYGLWEITEKGREHLQKNKTSFE